MSDQLTQAQAIYRTARQSGSNKAAAKRLVRERLPGFTEALLADKSYLASWGRAVQMIDRALTTNGHSDSNSRPPTLFPDDASLPAPFTTGPGFTRWLFERHVERAKDAGRPVQPGCTYTFSPNQCAAILHALTGRSLSPSGFVNEFLAKQTSLLQAAGWRFETVAKSSHELYTVKIVAVPAPPPAPEPAVPPPPAGPADNNTKLFEEFTNFLAWRKAQSA